MKLLLTTTLIASLSLAAAGDARAQTRRQRPRQPPQKEMVIIAPVQVPVDQGRLEGGRYSNDFFGLSFDIPKGWVAQDAAARQALMERGREIVGEGASAGTKTRLDSSISRTAFLLSASKYELGASGPDFNAQLSCIAERVPTAVVKTGVDYINLMMRTAQGTAAKLELTGPIRTERVGGVAFAMADAKLTTPMGTAAQKYYVTISKGYAVMLGFTYADEADAKVFDDIIRSVRFK